MAAEKTLTISSGSQNSNAWGAVTEMEEGVLIISGPSTTTGTITVEVDMNKDSGNRDWKTLQEKDNAGTDINIGDGDAVQIGTLPLPPLRIHSGSSEGADRDFKLFTSP